MTDEQKIEKLAKWMGWQLFEENGFRWWATLKGEEAASIGWNPLVNIADAWMLIEKAREKGIVGSIWGSFPVSDEGADYGVFDLSDSEAARAISDAVLEVIE